MKTKIIIMVLLLGSLAFAQNIETKRVPDFTLTDISGSNFTLSKHFGKGPIYISFWATWCKPCVEELKIIQKLYAKYQSQGFEVYAINTEGNRASAKIKSFVKSSGITFNVLLDNDGEVFRRTFKGSNMPFTVLTDANGRVLYSAVGFKPGDEVEIEKMVAANLLNADSQKETKGTEK
jgi:cytochrome c biogenesis protein CcmG, thiol:disulfide interchange protein DsbE